MNELEVETAQILEAEQRLSESRLWQLQRAFFDQQGVAAWRDGIVPHYITNNPYLASAYAKLIIGFLRDCQAGRLLDLHDARAAFDPDAPIYIVELGAGSGRLAYQLLHMLLSEETQALLAGVRWTYVLTDVADTTLAFWLEHPRLQPFFAAGVLDVARFDLLADQTIKLHHANISLSVGSVTNPLIVLANYVFDSIPQDVFCFRDGHVFESLVTLTMPDATLNPADPALLRQLKLSYTRQPTSADYYPEPALNQLLAEYQATLSDTAMLLPVAALRGLAQLARLAAGRLLVLSSDKGDCRLDQLIDRNEPQLIVHGSISLPVNYHALMRYTEQQGGQTLAPTEVYESLSIVALLFGAAASRYPETRSAYAQAVLQANPADFFMLKKAIEPHYATLTPHQLLAYLRMSGWDSSILLGCWAGLAEQMPTLSEREKQAWLAALQKVWERYLPLGEPTDLAFTLGVLIFALEYYPEALVYFEHSLALYGPDISTVYNLSMCHYRLRAFDQALHWIEQALEIDPKFDDARSLRLNIEAATPRSRRVQ